MSVYVLIIFSIFAMFRLSSGHGVHGFQDVTDREHMQQHLHGTNAESLLEKDMRFHYFHSHDIDGNSKLDGLEILQAFTHYHSTSDIGANMDDSVYSDFVFESAIDPLLIKTIDTNQDGYLDYSEFIEAERRVQEQDTYA